MRLGPTGALDASVAAAVAAAVAACGVERARGFDEWSAGLRREEAETRRDAPESAPSAIRRWPMRRVAKRASSACAPQARVPMCKTYFSHFPRGFGKVSATLSFSNLKQT